MLFKFTGAPMRQMLFAVLFVLAGLSPPSAAASGFGSERLKLQYFSEGGTTEAASPREPSVLQRVGFFSLGVVASFGSLFVAAPVISGLGLEGTVSTVVGAAVILGVSALAHYGLAVLFGIPISVPTVLIGSAVGAGAGVLAVLAVVALSGPQPGFEGLGTIALALAAGALAYGVVSPLLVLIDPFGFARVTPSERAQLHSQAKGPTRSLPLQERFTVPLLARSF